MTNSLRLSWDDVRYGGLKPVYEAVESALAEAGIDFYYLIGAQARDLWYAHEKGSSRTTRDVDFAVLVADEQQHTAVKNLLVKTHRFVEAANNAFAMISPDGTTADILPFGDIEWESKSIIGGQGLTSVRVDGFREVGLAGTAEAVFDDGEKPAFRLATLPAIVLLKLIAYDDRPDQRYKDAEDIAYIISTFFDVAAELFYNVHYDVLEDIDRGRAYIGARVIGRQMRSILEQSAALEHRVRGIIAGHIGKGTDAVFIRGMAHQSGLPINEAIASLAEMQQGLDQEAPSV